MPQIYKDIYNIFETPVILAKAFAAEFKKITDEFISANGNINIALSGGNTPKLLYSILAEEYIDKILWSKINFYWADERCVPPESSESNFGEADRILFSKINLYENLHRIIGENDPSAEAERYSALLKQNLPFENDLPKFDLMLLGMGDDGHTASIFPDRMDLLKSEKYCETAVHPASNQKRITLTGKVINNSDRIYFLVTGKNKEHVVNIISERKEESLIYPAGNIKQKNGDVNWFLDNEAAGLIR
ncbi:MAG: 6-phosphogluconolactonase [Ignavibacteria bacterium]|nr:6-phosphogluconolactonase [Ignavibacteria bacterium]